MKRLLTLPAPENAPKCEVRTYNPEDNDIRTVLSDLADQWEDARVVMAVHLPDRTLRTGTDVGIFLEQAPMALRLLEAGMPCTITMYEQTAMLNIDIIPEAAQAHLTSRPWDAGTNRQTWELEMSTVLDDLRAGIALVEWCVADSQSDLIRLWVRDWRHGAPGDSSDVERRGKS